MQALRPSSIVSPAQRCSSARRTAVVCSAQRQGPSKLQQVLNVAGTAVLAASVSLLPVG